MKSTDGKDLKKNHYYYTRSGQGVLLGDWGMGQNGPVFLVCRIYEGEAMTANGDGGSHHEITMDYEHEGEIEPVCELFKEAPIFIIEEQYKQKAEEVTALCQSIGKLESVLKASESEARISVAEANKITLQINNHGNTLTRLQADIASAKETLEERTAQISNAEDRLGNLKQAGDVATISQDELGELRKDQFKLQCLEAGGVDNWQWYDESLENFRARYP